MDERRKRDEELRRSLIFGSAIVSRETHGTLTLDEELWGSAAGEHEFSSDPTAIERVELTNVADGESVQDKKNPTPDYALVPVPQSPEQVARIAAAISSDNLRPTRNISRDHTYFNSFFASFWPRAKALQTPSVNRDAAFAGVLFFVGVGLLAGGASHGNVGLMIAGGACLLLSLYFSMRVQDAQDKQNKFSATISERDMWGYCPTLRY